MEKKKMNFGGKQVSIPYEIMFEILSCLPVKSLMRFKCVSVLCNSRVSESDFWDIHRCHSMTRHGGIKFFLHDGKAFYSAELEEDGNISASRFSELYHHAPVDSRLSCCNGLFCIWEPLSVRPAVIFNPSTREVRFLPDPNNCSFRRNYFLGFEPEENKYKVLLLEWRTGYVKQWVLTLGIDESWRETQSVSPCIAYGKPSVCIGGVIYLFVRAPKCAIAAFDVKSEKFEIIALWINESHWLYYYDLVEVKGKLAVVDYPWVTEYFNLRILEQAPKSEYWHRHIIQFPTLWNYKMFGPISSCTSYDGKIVFIESGSLCWCYDVITKRWRKLGIEGLPEETRVQGIYSYVEALDRCI